MENIKQILEKQGITLTEEQGKAVNEDVNANYRTIVDYNKQKDKLELANQNLSETKKSLDDFKKEYEGVDINDLKGKVDTLTQQLADKDTEYQTKLSTIDLNNKTKQKLSELGCLDVDLALSQIDTDSLLKSKNQDADLDTALNSLKENKALLFKANEEPAGKANVGGKIGNNSNESYDAKLAEAFGLQEGE